MGQQLPSSHTAEEVEVDYPKSLAEVIKYIESDKPIPGIETIDVEPSGEPISESQLERPRKPWETS